MDGNKKKFDKIYLDETHNCPKCKKTMRAYLYRIGIQASATHFLGEHQGAFGDTKHYSTNYQIIENGRCAFCTRCYFKKSLLPLLVSIAIVLALFVAEITLRQSELIPHIPFGAIGLILLFVAILYMVIVTVFESGKNNESLLNMLLLLFSFEKIALNRLMSQKVATDEKYNGLMFFIRDEQKGYWVD